MISWRRVEREESKGPLGRCLVTGASGYLGGHLVRELARRGHSVLALDRVPFRFESPSGCIDGPYPTDDVRALCGDIRDRRVVADACEGVDTVFHTAATMCFYRFVSPSVRAYHHDVNVGGTDNLLSAAAEAGVSRLVYTSSNNVTFESPFTAGDESRTYSRERDVYTETKVLAEQRVLQADGNSQLRTCAVRPGGIYGPGEKMILGRFVDELRAGRFILRLGNGAAESDNSFILNLVDGHLEAALNLGPDSPLRAQAYNIHDGHSINYFEFFRPYTEALGYRFPKLRLSASLVHPFILAWEWAHGVLGAPEPMLSVLEFRKLVLSHSNTLSKAHRDFGWRPPVSHEEAMELTVPWCKELLGMRETVERPAWYWWLLIPFGMGLLAAMSFVPDVYSWWESHLTPMVPRWVLAMVFVWAVLTHVWKGMKAVKMAERAGLHSVSMGWGWQTLLLGFASLAKLEARIHRKPGLGDESSPNA